MARCPTGMWSTAGNDTCQECPFGSELADVPQSGTVKDCLCARGYYSANNDASPPCAPCPTGFFKGLTPPSPPPSPPFSSSFSATTTSSLTRPRAGRSSSFDRLELLPILPSWNVRASLASRQHGLVQGLQRYLRGLLSTCQHQRGEDAVARCSESAELSSAHSRTASAGSSWGWSSYSTAARQTCTRGTSQEEDSSKSRRQTS